MILFMFCCIKYVTAQQSLKIQNYIQNNFNEKGRYIKETKLLYRKNGYEYIWYNNTGKHLFNDIINNLKYVKLKKESYQLDIINIESMKNVNYEKDSIEIDFRLTNIMVNIVLDFYFGSQKPYLSYNLINNQVIIENIIEKMAKMLSNKNIVLTNFLDDTYFIPEVNYIYSKIEKIEKSINQPNFKEYYINSVKISIKNQLLINKLVQLNLLDTLNEKITDELLNGKLKSAQYIFNLPEKNELNNELKYALNIPIVERLNQLYTSLNYYKWLSCVIQNTKIPIIVVNIPSASMKVYENNKIILEMKMVLGKKRTPTPTLSSTVNNIILYPYWHVPYSIATKELLPIIKKDPDYINRGNYQVLNNSGKLINPFSINWNTLNKNYFPYTIRQGTGCDNSLGLLKVDFDNPFGVYLHDTPTKQYFNREKRFYSHGCMRMEKPIELGRIILSNNHIAIDTLIEKGCLLNKQPIIVNADKKATVIVWYNLIGLDQNENIIFYNNIYNKSNKP